MNIKYLLAILCTSTSILVSVSNANIGPFDSYDIGIDVGGTNTDAALVGYSAGKASVIATFKAQTDEQEPINGIKAAMQGLLGRAPEADTSKVRNITLGTTHLLNAIVQGNLNATAVIRLGLPATTSIPPLVDWNPGLKSKLGEHIYTVNGGNEYNGQEISAIDEKQIASIGQTLKESGIKHAAITGVYSISNPTQELRVAQILQDVYPELTLSLSHRIGGFGLLERENANALSAALQDVYNRVCGSGLRKISQELNMSTCQLFLSRNDGTLENISDTMSASNFAPTAVKTVNSGPSNTMIGAAILNESRNVIVVDVGGTTTDLGIIGTSGFPGENRSFFEVTPGSGIECSFPQPRVESFGLGGGSHIIVNADGTVQISTQSVGNELLTKSVAFGGNVLTTSDVAIAMGHLQIEGADQEKVKSNISNDVLQKAWDEMHRKLADHIRHSQDSVEDKPAEVVLVGGGADLFDHEKLKAALQDRGITKITKPEHAEATNAVGAAFAKVGGVVDYVAELDKISEEGAIEVAKRNAIANAVKNGASPDILRDSSLVTVKSQLVDKINYVAGNPHKIRIEVCAKLATGQEEAFDMGAWEAETQRIAKEHAKESSTPATQSSFDDNEFVTPFSLSMDRLHTITSDHAATIDAASHELSAQDISDMALGCGILGSGGGGSTRFPYKIAKEQSREKKFPKVVSPEHLPADAVVVTFGMVGSPKIIEEKLPSGEEIFFSIRALEQRQNRKVDAILVGEIGGANGIFPLVAAAELGIPVVDADTMGRAFPNISDTTTFIYGKDEVEYNSVVANAKKQRVIDASSFEEMGGRIGAATVDMGGSLFLGFNILTGKQVARKDPENQSGLTIHGTVTAAKNIGRAIREARTAGKNIMTSLNDYLKAAKLDYEVARDIVTGSTEHAQAGKVVGITSSEDGRFSHSIVTIQYPNGDKVKVGVKNENLVVFKINEDGSHTVLEETPNLITMVDPDNFEPITCSTWKFGQSVALISLKAPKLINTERARSFVGPEAMKISELIESAKTGL